MPQWVADHPDYPGMVEDIAREVGLEMVEDPFEQLALAGEVLQVAAKRTMAAAGEPAPAQRPAWVAHWLSAARTAPRRGDLRGLRQALLRAPVNRDLFDGAIGALVSDARDAEALRGIVHDSLVQSRCTDLENADSG